MAMNNNSAVNEIGIERISPSTGRSYYTPVVSQSLKPSIGMVFDSVEHAYDFYLKYAVASGFSVRRNTSYKGASFKDNGLLKLKYFVCSKQGFKSGRVFNTLANGDKGEVKRRKPSKRTGCGANIKMQLNKDKKYVVYVFQEEHNHSFVAKDDIQFMSSSRKVDYSNESAIQALSNINLGPIRSFNILKALYGSSEDIGATKSDFKNYKRDLNEYIGEYDAEMVIQRLERKKQFCSSFSFEYTVKGDGTLGGLFWADEQMKTNYLVFGDVVGFDATYRSNKYDMVFVPFTGIDNHNRNITLGAAIHGSETAESYRWLLRTYINAFGSPPKVVVTDQDAAVKRVVQDVLPNSRHRLCMWHIWEKVTSKVGPATSNIREFKEKLGEIVWSDSIAPTYFEERWRTILLEYGLSDHDWLGELYKFRKDWIPAFYIMEELAGLMRTTSRSESENHYFKQFCNSQSTLVEFFSHFETAMEAQRYEHRRNDYETRDKDPDIWSTFVLENQAAKIFTRTLFLDQQLEIDAAVNSCSSAHREKAGDFMRFEVEDLLQPGFSCFEVMFRKEDETIYCSCRRFEQFGLLCRHIFTVLRLCYIREFPKKYVARRWTREVVPNSALRSSRTEDSENNVDNTEAILREIRFAHEYTINRLVRDKDQLCLYRDYVKAYMPKADEVQFVAPPPSRRDRFAEITGMKDPCTFTVRNPVRIRTKGCGNNKRLKSAREIAISQAGKKQRGCGFCKGAGHNQRTCTLYKESTKKNDASTSSGVGSVQN